MCIRDSVGMFALTKPIPSITFIVVPYYPLFIVVLAICLTYIYQRHVSYHCDLFLSLHISNIYILSLIHISEPTRLLSISYAVFCLKKKKKKLHHYHRVISSH